MIRLQFALRELITWTAWAAFYCWLSGPLLRARELYAVGALFIILSWSAVAIDRWFRPDVRGWRQPVRGLLVGACAMSVLGAHAIFGMARFIHAYTPSPRPPDQTFWTMVAELEELGFIQSSGIESWPGGYWAIGTAFVKVIAWGAVSGLGAVILYSVPRLLDMSLDISRRRLP